MRLPATYQDFSVWADAVAGDGQLTSLPDEDVIASLRRLLTPVGINTTEVRAALPGRMDDVLVRSFVASLRDGGIARRPGRKTAPLSAPRSPAEVARAFLPAELQVLPDTILDPGWEDGETAWSTLVGARIATLSTPDRQAYAALCAILYCSCHPTSPPGRMLSEIERLDDVLVSTGADECDARSMTALHTAYLIENTVFPTDSDNVRLTVVKRAFSCEQSIDWLLDQRPELKSHLAPLRRALPDNRQGLLTDIDNFARQQKDVWKSNRRSQADKLCDSFGETLAAFVAREAQSTRMLHHCDKVRAQLAALQERGTPPHNGIVDFSYLERVITPKGRRLPGFQRIHMRARVTSGDGDLQFEFLAVEAEVGLRCYEPFFIRLLRSGTLLPPHLLTPELLDRRRDLAADWFLPNARYRPQDFLCPADQSVVARMASDLKAGIVVVPIECLAHGFTLTLLLMTTMAHTACRIGEAFQITYDRSSWTTVRIGEELLAAFYAIPKDQDEEMPYEVLPQITTILARLAQLAKRRERNGVIPTFVSGGDIPVHKRKSAQHVFAFDSRSIRTAEANHLLQTLAGGLLEIACHDVRHASANFARFRGASNRQIARLLRLKGDGVSVAPDYGRLTHKQLALLASTFSNGVQLMSEIMTDEVRELLGGPKSKKRKPAHQYNLFEEAA